MIIKSICDGEIIPIEDVDDIVFSERFMGDGLAIIPSDNKVYSPISGYIKYIYHTNHSLVIVSDDGYEILIHYGLGSYKIPEGVIKSSLKKGMYVKEGQLLLSVDFDHFEENNLKKLIVIVFLDIARINFNIKSNNIKSGDILEGVVNHG